MNGRSFILTRKCWRVGKAAREEAKEVAAASLQPCGPCMLWTIIPGQWGARGGGSYKREQCGKICVWRSQTQLPSRERSPEAEAHEGLLQVLPRNRQGAHNKRFPLTCSPKVQKRGWRAEAICKGWWQSLLLLPSQKVNHIPNVLLFTWKVTRTHRGLHLSSMGKKYHCQTSRPRCSLCWDRPEILRMSKTFLGCSEGNNVNGNVEIIKLLGLLGLIII